MSLLIKLPSRSRPDKLLSIVAEYQKMRSEDSTRFLLTLDEDDTATNTAAVRKVLSLWGNLTVVWGKSESKIDAVNRDLKQYIEPWEVVLLASDDMHPVQKGYDSIILQDMARYYPDTDGVLWYNDGYVGRKLNTLCILGRKYYERFGYIYHPSYVSLWCDNEFMDVGNILERQTYIDRCIIEHRHPIHGKSGMDDLYVSNEKYFQQDRQNYERRKKKNFDLNIHV